MTGEKRLQCAGGSGGGGCGRMPDGGRETCDRCTIVRLTSERDRAEARIIAQRDRAEVERMRPVVEAAQSVDWTVYIALGALAPVRDMDGARTAARVTAASAQLHALIDALEALEES